MEPKCSECQLGQIWVLVAPHLPEEKRRKVWDLLAQVEEELVGDGMRIRVDDRLGAAALGAVLGVFAYGLGSVYLQKLLATRGLSNLVRNPKFYVPLIVGGTATAVGALWDKDVTADGVFLFGVTVLSLWGLDLVMLYLSRRGATPPPPQPQPGGGGTTTPPPQGGNRNRLPGVGDNGAYTFKKPVEPTYVGGIRIAE